MIISIFLEYLYVLCITNASLPIALCPGLPILKWLIIQLRSTRNILRLSLFLFFARIAAFRSDYIYWDVRLSFIFCSCLLPFRYVIRLYSTKTDILQAVTERREVSDWPWNEGWTALHMVDKYGLMYFWLTTAFTLRIRLPYLNIIAILFLNCLLFYKDKIISIRHYVNAIFLAYPILYPLLWSYSCYKIAHLKRHATNSWSTDIYLRYHLIRTYYLVSRDIPISNKRRISLLLYSDAQLPSQEQHLDWLFISSTCSWNLFLYSVSSE